MQVLCDLRPTFLKCNCQTPADAQRYQLTFYKALNNKVTFNVEK